MKKEEFIESFCERSDITINDYNRHLVALPCACDGKDCEGWATVSNNELSVKSHNFLYNHEHESYRGRNLTPTTDEGE